MSAAALSEHFIIHNVHSAYLFLKQALSFLQGLQAVLVGLVSQALLWWLEELYQIPEAESHCL